MNLTLVRTDANKFGIFGKLQLWDSEEVICLTLEHAYVQPDGSFAPKVPEGEYTCVKGPHRLKSMTQDFTTFELQNVPGHTNILIHSGNYNDDSEGCILIGKKPSLDMQGRMIANSKETFENFMKMQSACKEFHLTVKSIICHPHFRVF